MSPKPSRTSYPDHQRWRFVQRALSDAELMEFAKAIVAADGKRLDECLFDLLAFLNISGVDYDELKKEYWLKLYVNIMHQCGLGYTSADGEFIQATELGRMVATTGNMRNYAYWWGLRFQFPFGYPKHKHYIDHGIAVQPIVLICQYLVELHNITGDFAKSYLTNLEIAAFLMTSKDNDPHVVVANCTKILSNRASGYDYSYERSMAGFIEAADHLFKRGRLWMSRLDLLKFNNDNIVLENQDHLNKINNFLNETEPPVIFTDNSQDMRNQFFVDAYSNLPPLTPPCMVSSPVRTSPTIPSPSNLAGTFIEGIVQKRSFQSALRRDMLRLYDRKCAICGLDIPDFLITSHIIPVGVDPSIANDRRNCLLLCALHDIALEKGYITIDSNYKVAINRAQIVGTTHTLIVNELLSRDGQVINPPSDSMFLPNKDYLARHKKLHNV